MRPQVPASFIPATGDQAIPPPSLRSPITRARFRAPVVGFDFELDAHSSARHDSPSRRRSLVHLLLGRPVVVVARGRVQRRPGQRGRPDSQSQLVPGQPGRHPDEQHACRPAERQHAWKVSLAPLPPTVWTPRGVRSLGTRASGDGLAERSQSGRLGQPGALPRPRLASGEMYALDR